MSISSSRRISRPVLHLQGAARTFALSIAPPQSPQRRLDLHHRNRSTLTNSSDEAEANSAPPRRFCTHRYILSFIRSHGTAGARYRADMACLHRWRRRRPHHPRRLSPMSLLPWWRLPQGHQLQLLRLSLALRLCSCCRSRCCTAPSFVRAAALLLLSLAVLLLHDLWQLQEFLLQHSLAVLLHDLLSASAFPAQASADLDHCFSSTSARTP